jgi:hypothetical protein
MDAERLQDRLSRGMGSAARVIGEDYDLFRPRGAARPLAPENRIMRLPVILDGGDPGYRRPRGYDRALRATFDSIAVRVGDYLRGPRGVLFVTALPPMLFPLCILTNATVDVLRAGAPSTAGLNAYGGVVEDVLETLLAGWPAQIFAEASGRPGVLPADGGQTGWSVVLPPTPVPIATSDVLQDGAGRLYLVRAAEESEMGWRVSVRGTEV